MTVSTVDTAELPRVPELEVQDVVVPSLSLQPVAAPAPRAALREERRLARRQRRLWALLGLSIMLATLATTVVVLGMAR